VELLPSFGSGFAFAPKPRNITQTTVPKMPPSTPVVTQDTTENEKNKQNQ
jgi:hypothetical protein